MSASTATQVDTRVATERQTDMGLAATPSATLTQQQQVAAIDRTAKTARTAHGAQADAGTTAAGASAAAQYRAMTAMLTQLNEAANANAYVKSALSKERARVNGLAADASKQVLKAQQEYLGTDFARRRARFGSKLVLFSLVATSLVVLAAAAWRSGSLPTWAFVVVAGVLGGAYALALALALGNANRRQRLHWERYYWGAPAGVSQTSAPAGDGSVGQCD